MTYGLALMSSGEAQGTGAPDTGVIGGFALSQALELSRFSTASPPYRTSSREPEPCSGSRGRCFAVRLDCGQ